MYPITTIQEALGETISGGFFLSRYAASFDRYGFSAADVCR
jgi:hypothetical protein